MSVAESYRYGFSEGARLGELDSEQKDPARHNYAALWRESAATARTTAVDENGRREAAYLLGVVRGYRDRVL